MATATRSGAPLDLSVIGKAGDLMRRIKFTLICLIVYRLGTYIPLPGIDPKALSDIFAQYQGGILGMFDMFSGGALSRMTIFALTIMPYISASIMVQLVSAIVPRFEALKKEGPSGTKKLTQYTRYLTVVLAACQAFGIAAGLEGLKSPTGLTAVIDAGIYFRLQAVITLVGGTMLLMWLGEQITARGIGNGSSLIIFTGIVANLPVALARTLELGRTGALSTGLIVGILVAALAVVYGIVFMERAQRRIIVQYPKRQVGNRMYGGDSSHLPLKLNMSGVMPPIFASSLLVIPLTIANFYGDSAPVWLQPIQAALGHGQPLYMLFYAALIIFFAFFYTAVAFNPVETAENLKRYGGFVPGIRPGKNTADFFDHILTRLTVVGALYLVVVCLLPEFLISKLAVPFYFGGTSLLIVVNVTTDTMTQVQSHLMAHQYEGLIKKARLRTSRG